MSTNYISTIIELGNRAFSNLYDVEIIIDNTSSPLYAEIAKFISASPSAPAPISISKIGAVEAIQYDGQQGLESYTSEALQASYPIKAQRIKGVTLTFRESSDMYFTRLIDTWMNTIYDKYKNCFKKGDPRAKIVIKVYDPADNSKWTVFDHRGCIPTSLPFPVLGYADSQALNVISRFSAEAVYIYSAPALTP